MRMTDELQDIIFGLIPEDGCDEAALTEIFEHVFRSPNTVANQRIPSMRDLAGRTKLGQSKIYSMIGGYKLAGKLTVRRGLGIFISPRFNAFGLSRNPFGAPDTPLPLLRKDDLISPALFWQCGNDVADPGWLNRRSFLELVKKNRNSIEFVKNAKWISYYRSRTLSGLLIDDLQSNRGFLFEPANFSLRYGQLATQLQLTHLLLGPADTMVTTMGHNGMLNSLLAARGINVLAIDPSDESGFLSALKGLARKKQLRLLHLHPRAGLLGRRMSAWLMQELIDLAIEYGIWLLEEDNDHEFYFAKDEFRPLAAHDHRGQVIHCRPVSLLDPDFRRMWQVIAVGDIIDRLNRLPDKALGYADLAKEQSLEELLRSNRWVLTVQQAREHALKNRNELFGLFDNFLSGHAAVTLPDAGLNMAIRPHVQQQLAVFASQLPAHPNPINGQCTGSTPKPAMQWLRMGFARFDQKELLSQLKSLAETLNLAT